MCDCHAASALALATRASKEVPFWPNCEMYGTPADFGRRGAALTFMFFGGQLEAIFAIVGSLARHSEVGGANLPERSTVDEASGVEWNWPQKVARPRPLPTPRKRSETELDSSRRPSFD